MKIFHNIKSYRKGRKQRISRLTLIRHIRTTGLYDHEDAFVAVAIAALIGINVVLSYAADIDSATISWQAQAMHWHSKALTYEQNIVDMLNGQITINGRQRTVCLLNAAGDCEKK